MPGIKLVMQNAEGQYGVSMCTLMYEGHMLNYNPHRNTSKWVPMRGVSLSLTSVELRSANYLNNIYPYPHYGQELTEPHSPQLVQGRPVGEETDTDSWNEPSDSEEWDEHECGDWSCCPTPPPGEESLTWEEVTTEPPQRKVITDKEDSNWDVDQQSNTLAESQSQEVSDHSSPHKRHLWKQQNLKQNHHMMMH